MVINLDTVLKQSPGILSSNLDGETVLLEMESEKYFGMNRVSSRVWELLAEPQQLRVICVRLTEQFEVDSEQCEREVIALAQQMADANLVRTV